MEQKVTVVHAGERITARPPGPDFTQIAAFRVGFHQVGQNTATPVTAFDNGTGRAITEDQ
ncbi:hypothetical protein D3C72_2234060 [compost metagenome]